MESSRYYRTAFHMRSERSSGGISFISAGLLSRKNSSSLVCCCKGGELQSNLASALISTVKLLFPTTNVMKKRHEESSALLQKSRSHEKVQTTVKERRPAATFHTSSRLVMITWLVQLFPFSEMFSKAASLKPSDGS